FDRTLPERPLDVAFVSSPIDLGLVGGITDAIQKATGQLRMKVKAVGSSRNPHFDGTVNLDAASFILTATGVHYKNGQAAFRLAPDRVEVDTFHLEDEDGRSLEVRGSLGTHELRVGELALEITANRFQVV